MKRKLLSILLTFCLAFSLLPTAALADGEKIALAGFGTFETRERAARTGRDPRTKQPIEIAAATVPAFKANKALKDAVNK